MAKVIICSTKFLSYHSEAGKETHFIEKIWSGILQNKDNCITANYPKSGESYKLLGREFADKYYELLLAGYINDVASYLPKIHTIRGGKRWKVGDKCSLRIWSGKPYRSKQITIAPDMEIKSVLDFQLIGGKCFIDGKEFTNFAELAKNDGLTESQFFAWFKNFSFHFEGQIISWVDINNYSRYDIYSSK